MSSSTQHSIQVLLIIPLLLLFVSPTISQPEFTSYVCGDDDGNYTIDSNTYRENRQTLLSSITSNPRINYGFYNLSVGKNMDKVHGVALCRGDISVPDCKTCIGYAAARIISDCPNYKTALGWYEKCMIRYSNTNIFKGEMSRPRYNLTSGNDAPDPKIFNQTVSNLMMGLANKAASGDSLLKFATGEANVTSKLRVYALLQCIPDLEKFDCLECLKLIVNYTLDDCCYGKQGVSAGGPTCNIRFENYRFYKSAVVLPPLLTPAPPPFLSLSPPAVSFPSKKGNRSNRNRIAIIIIIPLVTSLVLIVLVCCYSTRRRRAKPLEKVENADQEDDIRMIESLQLELGTVRAATDSFSDSNMLGQGGFGIVYKGILPSTGTLIAVKRLSRNSGQGVREFKTEALLVAKLQHRNLVRFLGFCYGKHERILVYEFLPNKSLDYFLFDPANRVHLDWPQRYKIIGGIARGLLYLHEESRLLVVHRDLKASNVLLDAEMNPKISDFGMARLFGGDQSHANTSKIAGTYGYMPPEYLIHGHFSIKTDVYSFGVLVLEIISGQKVSKFSHAENGDSLPSYAWRNWLEGNALNLVDSTISAVDTTEVLRCINIALLCVQENAAQRPIMSSVVLMLNTQSITLAVPSRPAFLAQNDMDSDYPTLEPNEQPVDGSINEISLSKIEPR